MLGSDDTGASAPTAGGDTRPGGSSGDVDSVTGVSPVFILGTAADPIVTVGVLATATQPVGASTPGAAANLARGDHAHAVLRVANRAALVLLSAATMNDGTTCWVDTYGAYFVLQTSALVVSTDTIIAAAGVGGKQWIRAQQPNRANWSKTQWYVNPAAGSNEAAGDIATPLASITEWSRRVYMAQWASTVTLNLVTAIATTDDLNATVERGVNLDVRGTETVAQALLVTAAQAKNAATNLANEITCGAFNFTPHLGKLVRVQGTDNYAAITKIVGAGIVRLSELWNATTNALVNTTGIANGQTIEIVDRTQGPLNVRLTGQCAMRMFDVQLGAGTGTVVIRKLTSEPMSYRRVVFSAASLIRSHGFTTDNFIVCSFAMSGTLIFSGSSTEAFSGCAFRATSCTFNARETTLASAVFQACPIACFNQLLNVDNDLGTFDLLAAANGIETNNDSPNIVVHFNSGRHYGGGNNAAAWMWKVDPQCSIRYQVASPPTMNAGLGVRINGGNTAIGGLPVNLSLTTGSAVYAV